MEHDWPDWWHWELELTPHLLRRMKDRGFNETELRQMLDLAGSLRRATMPGRFMVAARYNQRDWQIVVEPDTAAKKLLVITAYVTESL